MSSAEPAFVSVLLQHRIVTPAQVAEVRSHVATVGVSWPDAFVLLGYATSEQILRARAEVLHLRFLDLTDLVIPPHIVELLPESVARENVVFPVAVEGGLLVLATCEPEDGATAEKLTFILQKHIQYVLAPHEQIVEAINRHYGQCETESVDSMLAEFTDTAIDFTETAAVPQSSPAPSRPRVVERRATVRYYERMNPERLYPLLVVLSQAEIAQVAQRRVAQAQSQGFRVANDSVVEVEPILPGCDCYPLRAQVTITEGLVQAEFWVAPHVVGPLRAARVIVRQDGRTLAEVPLEARVSRQVLTWLLAGLSCVLPFLLLVLQHFRLDFQSQREEGYGLYAQVAGWLVQSLTPELLTVLLLALTGCLYLSLRPRQRDVFHDITPLPLPASEEPARVTPSGPRAYFDAALAAHRAGDTIEALAILRRAEVELEPSQMTGAMWYNMACFASLLGQHPAAMGYLESAVEAGYCDAVKMRTDPDLAPLRLAHSFKRLVASLVGSGSR